MSTVCDPVEAASDAQLQQYRDRINADRANRSANTILAYKDKAKAWSAFCDKEYAALPCDRRYTVSADKVHAWLRNDLMTRQKKSGHMKPDGSRGVLSYSTLKAFVAGAVDLWKEQQGSGINSHPHPAPRDGVVQKLLETRKQQDVQKRRDILLQRRQCATPETAVSEGPQSNEYSRRESSDDLAAEVTMGSLSRQMAELKEDVFRVNELLSVLHKREEERKQEWDEVVHQCKAASSLLREIQDLLNSPSDAVAAGADESSRRAACVVAASANGPGRQSARSSVPINDGHRGAELVVSRVDSAAPIVASASGRAAAAAAAEQPAFSLSRNITTVAELWQEWQCGINGRLSVLEMDSRHGTSWRRGVCERKFYSNRKVIISEIHLLVQKQAISTEDAVALLEQRRGRRSLDWLSKQIKADRRAIESEEDSPGTAVQNQSGSAGGGELGVHVKGEDDPTDSASWTWTLENTQVNRRLTNLSAAMRFW